MRNTKTFLRLLLVRGKKTVTQTLGVKSKRENCYDIILITFGRYLVCPPRVEISFFFWITLLTDQCCSLIISLWLVCGSLLFCTFLLFWSSAYWSLAWPSLNHRSPDSLNSCYTGILLFYHSDGWATLTNSLGLLLHLSLKSLKFKQVVSPISVPKSINTFVFCSSDLNPTVDHPYLLCIMIFVTHQLTVLWRSQL